MSSVSKTARKLLLLGFLFVFPTWLTFVNNPIISNVKLAQNAQKNTGLKQTPQTLKQ